jgi:hypothetical protein
MPRIIGLSILVLAAACQSTIPMREEITLGTTLGVCGPTGGFPPLSFPGLEAVYVFNTAQASRMRVSPQDARSVKVTGVTLSVDPTSAEDLSIFKRVAFGVQAGAAASAPLTKVAEKVGFVPGEKSATLTLTHADFLADARQYMVAFLTDVEMARCATVPVPINVTLKWEVQADANPAARVLTP